MTAGRRLADALASAAATLLLSAAFAGAAALILRCLWHPRPAFFAYNIPIAVPFAAFFVDRLLPRPAPGAAPHALDVAVLLLALLRVFAPPLPYASGHALFTAYAALTARRWPLRVTAAAVLLQVAYTKLFLTGGALSLLAGLALAALAAAARRRLVTAP